LRSIAACAEFSGRACFRRYERLPFRPRQPVAALA
jgi:hypothetical protein